MTNQPDQRHEAILGAVIQLLAESGSEGVTFVRVGRQAEVGRGAVAYHFKTRSRLFQAALDWLVEKLTRLRNSLDSTASTPRQKLNAMFRGQEKLLLDEPRLLCAWYAFVALGPSDRWIAARVQQNYLDRVEEIRLWLKDLGPHCAKGVRLAPGRIAGDLTASIEGMGLLWLNHPDAKGIAAHRRRLVQRWQKALFTPD